MAGEDRRTNRTGAPSDLSRRVRDYYAECVGTEPEREEFERLAEGVWAELLEAEQSGADGGFLLHVLVCTKFRRATPNIDRSETLQRLNPPKRAALLAGLRAIRELKETGLQEIFGPQGHDWARKVHEGVEYLHHQLTGGTVETPAFQTGSRAKLPRGQTERAVTACVVCLMDQLKGHPKPAAAVAILLEKFGLLRRSRPGQAAIDFVKKRASRAAANATDRLGPIGNAVWLLRQTYEGLDEFLSLAPAIPDTSPVWRARGKVWGVTGLKFHRTFQVFCDGHGIRPTQKALLRFERALSETKELEGPDALRHAFRRGDRLHRPGRGGLG